MGFGRCLGISVEIQVTYRLAGKMKINTKTGTKESHPTPPRRTTPCHCTTLAEPPPPLSSSLPLLPLPPFSLHCFPRPVTKPPPRRLTQTSRPPRPPQPSPSSPPSSLLPSITLFLPQPPNRRPASTKDRHRAASQRRRVATTTTTPPPSL
nr:leucine-rich repeat extensin-like protein 5 [Arachis hypogaea]